MFKKFFLLATASALDAMISVSPDTVSTEASLEMMISFDESLGKGGLISIFVPDDQPLIEEQGFTESSLNKALTFKNGQLTCRTDQTSIMIAQCTAGTHQLDIWIDPKSFILAGQSIVFTVENGVTNPSSQWYLQNSLKIITYSQLSQPIEERSEFLFLTSLTPSKISEVTLQYSSHIFGLENQSLTVNFKTIQAIPKGGRVEISVPRRTQQFSDSLFSINKDSFSIKSFTINGIEQQAYKHDLMNVGLDQILVIYSLSADVSAAAVLKIEITEFNNPIEINNDVGLKITTLDNMLSIIDQSSLTPLSVSTPAQIIDSSLIIDSGSSIISQNSGLQLDFSSPIPLVAGCIIQINVPESFSTSALRYVYAYGLFGSMRSLPFETDKGQVKIKEGCTSLLRNDKVASIKIKYLKNPDSIRDSGDFEILIKDKNENLIAKNSKTLQIYSESLKPGSLLSTQIIPQNTTVAEPNDIMIQFQISNKLETIKSPSFKIIVPELFQIQKTCQFESFSSGLNTVSSCKIEGQSILLQNVANQANQYLEGSVIFKVTGALKNPLTVTQSVGSFTIQTLLNDSEIVDQAQVINPFNILPGELYLATMTFQPSLNNMLNPSITISFKNQHALVSGSDISIWIPITEIEVNEVQEVSCSGLRINTISCKKQIVYNEVGEENLLVSIKTSENVAALQGFEFNFQNLFKVTPRFQGQMSQPVMFQTSISDQMVDESKSYPNIERVSQMKDFKISLGSNVNLSPSSLDISIDMNIPEILEGDYLMINVPQEMKIDSVNCAPMICQYSDSKITVKGFKATKFDIKIQGITNFESTRPVGPYSVFAYDKKDRILQNWNENGLIYLSTLQAYSTQKVRMIQSNSKPQLSANFTLTIEKSFEVSSLPWVKLTLPDCIQFEVGKSLQIYDQSAIDPSKMFYTYQKFSQFDYVFQLHSGINFFTLMNLKNPTEACLWQSKRLSFEFRTYEDAQLVYAMEQRLEGLEPSLSCKSPCATCQIIDKSFCKSCENPLSQVLLVDDGKCIEGTECPTGYFMNSNQVCKKCEAGCLECEKITGQCINCQAGFLLNQTQCIDADLCGPGNIIIDDTCQKCHKNCQECGQQGQTLMSMTHSPMYCTKCVDEEKYLHNGLCSSTCPAGSTPLDEDGLRFLAEKRECQELTIQPSNLRILIEDDVIQQTKFVYVLLHFPLSIVLLFPSCILQGYCQSGRYALDSKEQSFLLTDGVEYFGRYLIIIKAIIGINFLKVKKQEILDFDNAQENPILNIGESKSDRIIQFYSFLIVYSIIITILHHVVNEVFFRKLQALWEEHITEDFSETMRTRKKRCCVFQYLTLIRFFNYKEFVGLWKNKGMIIPKSEQLVIDSIQWLFLEHCRIDSLRTSLYITLPYLIFIIHLWISLNPMNLYYREPLPDYIPQEYADFNDVVKYIKWFLIMQLQDILTTRLVGQIKFNNWMQNVDILQYQREIWDYNDANTESTEQEEQEAGVPQVQQMNTVERQNRNREQIAQLYNDESIVQRTPDKFGSERREQFSQMDTQNRNKTSPSKFGSPGSVGRFEGGLGNWFAQKQKDVQDASMRSNLNELDTSMRPFNDQLALDQDSLPQRTKEIKEKFKNPTMSDMASSCKAFSFTKKGNEPAVIMEFSEMDGQSTQDLPEDFKEDPRFFICTCEYQNEISQEEVCTCSKNIIGFNQVMYDRVKEKEQDHFDFARDQIISMMDNDCLSSEAVHELFLQVKQMILEDGRWVRGVMTMMGKEEEFNQIESRSLQQVKAQIDELYEFAIKPITEADIEVTHREFEQRHQEKQVKKTVGFIEESEQS